MLEKERLMNQTQNTQADLAAFTPRARKKQHATLQPHISQLGLHDRLALTLAGIGALHEAGHTLLNINIIADASTPEIANICSGLFIVSGLYLTVMRGYFLKQSWFFRQAQPPAVR